MIGKIFCQFKKIIGIFLILCGITLLHLDFHHKLDVFQLGLRMFNGICCLWSILC
jgi:hypothetical protein